MDSMRWRFLIFLVTGLGVGSICVALDLGLGGLGARPTGAAHGSFIYNEGGTGPAPLDCGGLEGHGAGGDVEVFEAGELFAGFADGFDGGVVGVGEID